jgi:3'-phosphoadenosine 5'-phosphosulfate sulfotransferase (PAPS reductase)/FAD synthetase
MAIPPEIRDFETYIVAYSGGKDSTATLLWALDNLPRERVRVIHNPAGLADQPEVADYTTYIENELGVTVEQVCAGDRLLPVIKSRKPRQDWEKAHTLFDMIRLRGMWPGARYRYCNVFLKQWPTALYLQECENPILIVGQRADESKIRMGLPTFSKNGSSQSLPKRYHYSIYRPILTWSEREVWQFLRSRHILPNPVYNYQGRCGCWCCIMGKKHEVLNFCRLHPDIAQIAANLEQEIGHTWKERQSITNLLRQAQAQMLLFKPQPRFAEVAKC